MIYSHCTKCRNTSLIANKGSQFQTKERSCASNLVYVQEWVETRHIKTLKRRKILHPSAKRQRHDSTFELHPHRPHLRHKFQTNPEWKGSVGFLSEDALCVCHEVARKSVVVKLICAKGKGKGSHRSLEHLKVSEQKVWQILSPSVEHESLSETVVFIYTVRWVLVRKFPKPWTFCFKQIVGKIFFTHRECGSSENFYGGESTWSLRGRLWTWTLCRTFLIHNLQDSRYFANMSSMRSSVFGPPRRLKLLRVWLLLVWPWGWCRRCCELYWFRISRPQESPNSDPRRFFSYVNGPIWR